MADVKPVNTLARRIFNVPAPSDTTPILPVVRSADVATPPLMDNTSPCLRTDVVPVSPSNLCSASANACVVLSMAEFTTSATFFVVATPSLPAVVPCVEPVAPTLPVVSSITSLPSSTLTVYVLLPDASILLDTVASPVPSTFTASCASVLTLLEPVADKLDKSLLADFSAAVTAFCNFVLVPTVIVSPDTLVVTSASVPLSPTTLSLPVLRFTEPSIAPSLIVNVEEIPANASSICFLLTAASSVVPFLTPLIS